MTYALLFAFRYLLFLRVAVFLIQIHCVLPGSAPR